MITVHRIGHVTEPFELNPDLILTIEANPDTVVTLTTGTKIVVAEPRERVVDAIRAWRASVLAEALRRRKLPGGDDEGVAAQRAAHGVLAAVEAPRAGGR
jgi:flagellar protein FlbD